MSNSDLTWFQHDRFGLFVHWGLYSLGARHEWLMNRERVHESDYAKYTKVFEPDLYDPRDWAAQAKRAGMKYVVLTTKHHDGFCLWDSKLTDYTVVNTPYGKDLVRPFVEAVREAGLKVGFYHSLLDWHHPDFLVDGYHPRRDDADATQQNVGRDMARYREYLHGQVRELLSNYGKIDYLFYDFSYEKKDHNNIWGGREPKRGAPRNCSLSPVTFSQTLSSTTGSTYQATSSHRSSTSHRSQWRWTESRSLGRPVRR